MGNITKEFLETLLGTFNPNLDLSDGSPAQTEVIQPILDRLGTDPLSTKVRDFILDRLESEYPDYDFRGAGSVVGDVLADFPSAVILPIRQELQRSRISQGIKNPELLSRDEIKDLMSIYFDDMLDGSKSVGVIRLYFEDAQRVLIDFTNMAFTIGGLYFLPVTIQTITADEMALNTEGVYYYFDVVFEAEKEGPEYTIDAGQIAGVDGVARLIKAANPRAFSAAIALETNAEYAARMQDSLSKRTVETVRGMKSKVKLAVPEVQDITVVGFQDEEMIRDILKADVTPSGELQLATILVQQGKSSSPVPVPEDEDEDKQINLGKIELKENYKSAAETPIQPGDILTMQEVEYTIAEVDDSGENPIVTIADVSIVPVGPEDGKENVIKGYTEQFRPFGPDRVIMPITARIYADIGFSFKGADIDNIATFKRQSGGGWDLFPIQSVAGDGSYIESGPIVVHTGRLATDAGWDNVAYAVAGQKIWVNKKVAIPDVPFDLYMAVSTPPEGPYPNGKIWKIISFEFSGGETILTIEGSIEEFPSGNWALFYLPGYFGTGQSQNIMTEAWVPEQLYVIVTSWSPKLLAFVKKYGLWDGSSVDNPWTVRRPYSLETGDLQLTLSDIPGGILDNANVEFENNEVHIGSMTDVYVSHLPAYFEKKTIVYDNFEPQNPVIIGNDLQFTDGSDIVTSSALADMTVLDFFKLMVLEGEPGIYRVVKRINPTTIQVNHEFKAGGTSRFKLFGMVNAAPYISLKKPLIPRFSGMDLKTDINSKIVHTYVDVAKYGTLTGDILEIFSGSNVGIYVITAIAGTDVVLDRAPTHSDVGISFSVYKLLTPPDMPIAYIEKLECMDEAGNSYEIPNGDLLELRVSDEFTNEGYGIKHSGYGKTHEDDSSKFVITSNIMPSGVNAGDFLHILEGSMEGYYIIHDVDIPNMTVNILTDWVYGDALAEQNVQNLKFEIGAPSLGTVRAYFQAPQFVVCDIGQVVFTKDSMNFLLSRWSNFIARSRVGVENNLTIPGGDNKVESPERLDWHWEEVNYIKILTKPVYSDTGPDFSVSGLTLRIKLDELETRIIFAGSDPIPLASDVYPGGIIEQINRAVGTDIASVDGDRFRLDSGSRIYIGSGTANSTFGFQVGQTNTSDNAGMYEVSEIVKKGSGSELTLKDVMGGTTPVFSEEDNVKFEVWDRSNPSENPRDYKLPGDFKQDEKGMWYVEWELFSFGCGNEFNLPKDTVVDAAPAEIAGYTGCGLYSSGYRIISDNDALTFSPLEDSRLIIGYPLTDVEDSLELLDETFPIWTNLKLTYRYSDKVRLVHDYITSENVRATVASFLGKCLLPARVMFTLSYAGGSSAAIVKNDILNAIHKIPPGGELEKSDITAIVAKRGSHSITPPDEIILICEGIDRKRYMVRVRDIYSIPRIMKIYALSDNITINKVG